MVKRFPMLIGLTGAIALVFLLGAGTASADDNSTTAIPLVEGLNGPYDIDPAADEDWYTFYLSGETLVHLQTNGSYADGTMYLYDENESYIDYDDDGASPWSRIDRVLQAGTYYVVIALLSSYSTTYGYHLTLELVVPEPLSEGLNGPWDVSPAYDEDYFTFDVLEPSNVRIELNGTSGDSELHLLDENFSLIDSDDDGGSGLWSRIVRQLYAGTYYARVLSHSSGGTVMGYHVTLERVSLLGPDGNGIRENATLVSIGTNGLFDIDPSGDLDWYVITFPSAGVVDIQTNGSLNGTVMTLYDQNGSWLMQDLYSGAGYFSRIQAVVQDQPYYILVQAGYSWNYVYNYTLQIDLYPPPGPDANDDESEALPISAGETGTFSLVTGDVDWYSYVASTPGTLTVETNGPYGGASVQVQEPGGVIVASGTNTGNYSFQLASALVDVGTYIIRVQLPYYQMTAVMEYNITITFVPWVPIDGNDFRSEAQRLVQGLNGDYSISPQADVDWYFFDQAEAGYSVVQILGGNGQASVGLYNETGVLLSGGIYGNQQAAYTLQPGVYFVRLQSTYGYYTVASYFLNLTVPDTTDPGISGVSPANGAQVGTGAVEVRGVTEPGARAWINGAEIVVDGSGRFSTVLLLVVGNNYVNIMVRDPVGNEAYNNFTVVGVDPYTALTSQLAQANSELSTARGQLNASRAAEASASAQLSEANAQLTTAQEQAAAANASATMARIEADAQRGMATMGMIIAALGVAGGIALAFMMGRRRMPPPAVYPQPQSTSAPQAPAQAAPQAAPATDLTAVPLPSPTIMEQPRAPGQ